MSKSFTGTIGVALIACFITACGDAPQRHPVTLMADRYRPRMGLVEFVVKDAGRRERVLEVYGGIEELTFEWQERRASYLGRLFSLSEGDHHASDAELQALFAAGHEETVAMFDRYVDLQMAAREALTREEFERLDGAR